MSPQPVDEVSEVDGWINVITLLRRRECLPAVAVCTLPTGRYRLDFAYNAQVVEILKQTVPAAMRRWRDYRKYWEVSADWLGPLVCALRNAGVTVNGLGRLDVTEWASWYLPAVAPEQKGRRAYLLGLCASCRNQPHSPARIECDRCYRERVARSHRVYAALVAQGLAAWPRSTSSKGELLSLRAPVLLDEVNDWTPAPIPDVETVDAVIAAARERMDKPACPICERKPSKGATVHARCRRHLLHLLAEEPFSKPRNRAYQSGACSVCVTRPLAARSITCGHCAGLALEITQPTLKTEGKQHE